MENFSAALRKGVSTPRLDAYSARGVAPEFVDIYSHYLWNIALCESLYPALQTLEIVLRNNIHDALSHQFGTPRWYEPSATILQGPELRRVDDAKQDLMREGKPVTPGRVVAELSFGFWTVGLLRGAYEVSIWRSIIQPVFPRIPSSMRTRNTVSRLLNDIRDLRNRVFHHEPIWHLTNLTTKHQRILKMIQYMNPSMKDFVTIADNFPAVYRKGPSHHVDLIYDKIRELRLHSTIP